MKKSTRNLLIIYAIVGTALIIGGMVSGIEYYSSILVGMGAGLLANSVAQFARFWYNTKPENIEAYHEKMRRQTIDLRDERKVQLRSRAGYLTWVGAMLVCFVGAFVAALLREPLITAILFGEAVLLYAAATVIYKYLCKKC